MKQIDVGLAERSYSIVIEPGLLVNIGNHLRQSKIAKRYVVISDRQVADLYSNTLLSSLQSVGLQADIVTFPAGEESKNLTTIAELASRLANLGIDRKDGLIALGGGVTGDITGFLAAVYMRGIPFVQVPTTLLAQVDSSVGGKTGVDIPEGKNLVGSFYQPKAVFIDIDVLQSLPQEEILNGLAEVIKYGVIYDADFFDYLVQNRGDILALQDEVMVQVVARCCEIKAAVVAEDEKESDLRRILNFGHTLGHAVEAESGYTLAHGMAVSMGMVAANAIAVERHMMAPEDAHAIRNLLQDFGMPVAIPAELDRQKIKQYLKTDKKTIGGRPFFVLPEKIGKVIITDAVTEEMIDKAIQG